MIRKRQTASAKPAPTTEAGRRSRGGAAGGRGARGAQARGKGDEGDDAGPRARAEETGAGERVSRAALDGDEAGATEALGGDDSVGAFDPQGSAEAAEPRSEQGEQADQAEAAEAAEAAQQGDASAVADATAAHGADDPAAGLFEAGDLPLRVEALLFASGAALSVRRIASVLAVEAADVHAALALLVGAWAARRSALELVEVSGGYRLMTRPVHHADVARLAGKVRTEKLSPAALETLAVIAYRQPIGRAEVESIRGVQCGPLLRVLLDRDLIRITGRSDEPGHPLQYGTTKEFLDHFGLPSLKHLPDIKDLLSAP